MSIQSIPILMNQGLDLVSPPLLAEQGALIDCLNYEMTAHVGYRRVDGYERYDGWVDGGVASYFIVNLTADVPADQSKIVPGALLGDLDALSSKPLYYGVVVAVNGSEVRYVPFKRTDTISLGRRIYLLSEGITYFFTATSGSTSGKAAATDMELYTQELRDYSTILRGLVQEDTSAIAGITWSRDRLYKVLDMSYADWPTAAALNLGDRISIGGIRWAVGGKDAVNGSTVRIYMYPDGESALGNYTKVNPDGSSAGTVVAPSAPLTSEGSIYGYLVYVNNPEIAMDRGVTPIQPAATISLINGKWGNAAGPISGVDFLWLSDGTSTVKVKVSNWVAEDLDGSWVEGTKKARLQLSYDSRVSGNAWVPGAGWSVYSDATLASGAKVGELSGDLSLGKLAGTGAIRASGTRYQWGTYNFYAREDMYEMYGTNGVYRAFWATPESWGNIYTQDNDELDNPKYLSMHARSILALGFADGSVMLSVPGLPYSYLGVDGAAEMATGDRITGLLEAAGNSTLVFGKRSIGRIVGTSIENYSQATVVPNAGAYDYTCVNVGGQPVFTDPAGISTLEQSSAYGDFVGQRSSFKISTWLTPKLIPGTDSIELGGVACAMPCREKMQYRLFLNSGEVVSLCFSSEGAKPMISSYAIQDVPGATSVRVPLAWTSEVADSGKEMMFVVWDKALSEQGYDGTVGSIPSDKLAYRLDYGWGFDGRMMRHYIVLAHTFMSNGMVNGTVTQMRLYGQGYGVATLNIKSSSVERDFDMEFNDYNQDISLPARQEHFYDRMDNVTNIVDHANWGLGTKFRIGGTIAEGSPVTEPAYSAQVIVLTLDTTGAIDG